MRGLGFAATKLRFVPPRPNSCKPGDSHEQRRTPPPPEEASAECVRTPAKLAKQVKKARRTTLSWNKPRQLDIVPVAKSRATKSATSTAETSAEARSHQGSRTDSHLQPKSARASKSLPGSCQTTVRGCEHQILINTPTSQSNDTGLVMAVETPAKPRTRSPRQDHALSDFRKEGLRIPDTQEQRKPPFMEPERKRQRHFGGTSNSSESTSSTLAAKLHLSGAGERFPRRPSTDGHEVISSNEESDSGPESVDLLCDYAELPATARAPEEPAQSNVGGRDFIPDEDVSRCRSSMEESNSEPASLDLLCSDPWSDHPRIEEPSADPTCLNLAGNPRGEQILRQREMTSRMGAAAVIGYHSRLERSRFGDIDSLDKSDFVYLVKRTSCGHCAYNEICSNSMVPARGVWRAESSSQTPCLPNVGVKERPQPMALHQPITWVGHIRHWACLADGISFKRSRTSVILPRDFLIILSHCTTPIVVSWCLRLGRTA